MCHQEKPFKNDKVPKIASFEAHKADVAGDGDENKRCADCHLSKRIHRLPAKPAVEGAPATP